MSGNNQMEYVQKLEKYLDEGWKIHSQMQLLEILWIVKDTEESTNQEKEEKVPPTSKNPHTNKYLQDWNFKLQDDIRRLNLIDQKRQEWINKKLTKEFRNKIGNIIEQKIKDHFIKKSDVSIERLELIIWDIVTTEWENSEKIDLFFQSLSYIISIQKSLLENWASVTRKEYEKAAKHLDVVNRVMFKDINLN